jgi:hypothetical protein
VDKVRGAWLEGLSLVPYLEGISLTSSLCDQAPCPFVLPLVPAGT